MAKETKRIGVYILAAFILLPPLLSQKSIDSAGALEAVDRFFKTFNSRNPILWANSLHFPHIRKPGIGKPLRSSELSLSAEEYASRFDYSRIISTGWNNTQVESKSIIHITLNKAHIPALYHRYNKQGDIIRTTRVTYLVTKLDEQWGIQARFGAGEPYETEADSRQAETAALEAVDRYLEAFYRGESSDWASTLCYPFVNIRVGGINEIKTPDDAARFDRSRIDSQFNEGRMTWKSLRVIQTGSAGVNVVAELIRKDPSGRILASIDGLFLTTNFQGKWGVIGCSLIAHKAANKMTVKDRFVGTWELEHIEIKDPDGEWIHWKDGRFGPDPIGIGIYDAAGYMAVQIMARSRPSVDSSEIISGKVTPEEIRSLIIGYVAYFGTYEVNENEGYVVHHRRGSLFSKRVGTPAKRLFKFIGNRLILTPPTGDRRFIWKRILF